MLVRSDIFWNSSFKNTKNFSHESEKLTELYSSHSPDTIVLGSSWGEFAVDATLLSKNLNNNSFNLSVISTILIEHVALFYEYKKKFGNFPKRTILVFDFTHIPIIYIFPTLRITSQKEIMFLKEKTVRAFIDEYLSNKFFLYKYRIDIKTAILGLLTGKIKYKKMHKKVVEEIIPSWEKEKKWEKLKKIPSSSNLHTQFTQKQIKTFIKFLEKAFAGTELIVVNGPIALEHKTNFYEIFEKVLNPKNSSIKYFNYHKDITLDVSKHFYDLDHLNSKGKQKYTNWIADKILGSGNGL